jgi:predicted esterase
MTRRQDTGTSPQDPHARQPVLSAGPKPEEAAVTLLLIHGRGASAQSMLALYEELAVEQVAALAPQAANNTWYPHSFLAPLDANEPYLDSALRKIESLVQDLLIRKIPSEHIAILGFSQGACLTSEFIARHPRHYGAAMVLTGGLIGPEGTPRNHTGTLGGTPVFLGSGDPDIHVPFERVQETANVLGSMGAHAEVRRYPGMPHTVNADELEACRTLLKAAGR